MIVVPAKLQKPLVQWYHCILCHPGKTMTEATIAHFTWSHVLHMPTIQEDQKKYGQLPEKETESYPWEKLCVDMIGPYSIKR